MKQFHLKPVSLCALIIFALVLTGCARARPEQPETATGDSGTAQVPAVLATDTPALGEPDGEPTTMAVQATATPTGMAGAEDSSAAEPVVQEGTAIAATATATPLTSIAGATGSEPATEIDESTTTGSSTSLPVTSVAGERIHVVQPGQNLFRIALQYGIETNALAAYNGISDPALIYVGQKLKIPADAGGPATGSGGFYVVDPGDTLLSIAVQFNTTTEALMHANNLSDPDMIYVGQKISVP